MIVIHVTFLVAIITVNRVIVIVLVVIVLVVIDIGAICGIGRSMMVMVDGSVVMVGGIDFAMFVGSDIFIRTASFGERSGVRVSIGRMNQRRSRPFDGKRTLSFVIHRCGRRKQ